MLSRILVLLSFTPLALANNNEQASLMSTLPMLLVFVAVTYFMIIRPQQSEQKKHQEVLSSIKPGIEVSAGGIIGIVEKVDEQYVWVNIAKEVTMKIQKDTVRSILPKGTADK